MELRPWIELYHFSISLYSKWVFILYQTLLTVAPGTDPDFRLVISPSTIDTSTQGFKVSVTIRNTGSKVGKEVIQVKLTNIRNGKEYHVPLLGLFHRCRQFLILSFYCLFVLSRSRKFGHRFHSYSFFSTSCLVTLVPLGSCWSSGWSIHGESRDYIRYIQLCWGLKKNLFEYGCGVESTEDDIYTRQGLNSDQLCHSWLGKRVSTHFLNPSFSSLVGLSATTFLLDLRLIYSPDFHVSHCKTIRTHADFHWATAETRDILWRVNVRVDAQRTLACGEIQKPG